MARDTLVRRDEKGGKRLITRTSDANHLIAAYQKSIKNSDWKTSVQHYEYKWLANVAKTQKELDLGTYEQLPFVEFDISERGHTRHISSIHIKDRVVQRSLCDYVLTPDLQNYLIFDNGASQVGKGVDFARRRLENYLRDYYKHYGTDGYILLTDFHGFFASLPHAKLEYQILDRVESDEDLISYLININEGTHGVGIGSQISQICGIFYPTPFDTLAKNVRSIHAYERYMDDTISMHRTKNQAKETLDAFRQESSYLDLELNENKVQIVPMSRGFTFLKVQYRFGENGKLLMRLENEAFRRERRRLKRYKNIELSPDIVKNSYRSWRGSVLKYSSSWSRVIETDKLYTQLFPDWDWRITK